jgi:hypothetical protein
MKNKQKELSWNAKFQASVALRTIITKQWINRRNVQKIPTFKSSVDFWTKELRSNISAYRELNS